MDKSYTDTNTNSSDFPDDLGRACIAGDTPPGRLEDSTRFHLTHARHDCAICLAPGLFRSLAKGGRGKQKLDIQYEHGRELIHFLGNELLGADDLRVLQVLVATAGPSGRYLPPEPETDRGARLRALLETKHDDSLRRTLVIEQSTSSLLREAGMTRGAAIKGFQESLARLAAVTVTSTLTTTFNGRRLDSREASSQLLSYIFDETSRRLRVALSPRMATAVIGGRKTRYTRIEMGEVRALSDKSDAARVIHQRLCAWIDPGALGRVELDTLCGYAWPDDASASAMRKRRQRAKAALGDLRALGWTIAQYAVNKFEITRPPLARP